MIVHFEVDPIPDTIAPTVPTNLASTATAFDANLTWNASTDADSSIAVYRVYRNGGAAPIGTATGLAYSDFNVVENATYSYQISAVDASGNESVLSNSFAITIPVNFDVTAPTEVTGIVASSTFHNVTLSWNASTDTDSGVFSYRIYRDGSATPLGDVSDLGYIDKNVAASTTYTYEITAVDRADNESSRSVIIITTLVAP